MAAFPALAADDGWISLFNGRTLDGWRPSEHKDSWQVRDGEIVADGARSHLFYNGPANGAGFKNFDLEVELLAKPGCNSGVYFHTAYQESGFPIKGFEIQVNNTALGEGTYRERKKTGSLYGLRNVYKQLIADDTWFKMQVAVRGKNVQIRLNGALVVDYTEPTPPVIPPGMERERYLDRGTFALQCHNPGSVARFRSVKVRPAADDAAAPGPAPVVDETFRQIIDVGRSNIPVVDYHVHLKGGLTLEQALARSRRDGIGYGIAVNCGKGFPIESDAGAIQFHESMKGQPCFIAMQAEGREWMQMFTRKAAGLFDYIFTDSMTWTDNRGKRMRLWIPEEVGTIGDAQEFMETLVSRAVGILEREPIDIYVNPTYLPDQIAKDYDRLWTEERMKKVVETAARNNVAIELNDRYKLPGAAFVKMAKAAGCKFTFGTNNTGANDLRRSEYGLKMIQECRLGWADFFVPGAWWPKAAERKGNALRA
jgi:3-keto-disaccharide hydrolase